MEKTMSNELNVKNIDDYLLERLQTKADRKGVDINTFILTILKQAAEQNSVRPYQTLDADNTWSEEETEAFIKATENTNRFAYEIS